MTDAPEHNTAELVSKVLDNTQRLTRRGHRLTGMIIVFLLCVSGFLIYLHISDESTIASQRISYMTLSNKSAEQTVAEVQLREDVNNFKNQAAVNAANHSATLTLLCWADKGSLIPIPLYDKYCSGI